MKVAETGMNNLDDVNTSSTGMMRVRWTEILRIIGEFHRSGECFTLSPCSWEHAQTTPARHIWLCCHLQHADVLNACVVV